MVGDEGHFGRGHLDEVGHIAPTVQTAADHRQQQAQRRRSRTDLTEPDVVPVDVLRAEFAATVGLIAKTVIDFSAAPYKLPIKRVDVINPEVHVLNGSYPN
jgi:hypothetical protein